jgi:hypothetical protein
MEGIAACMTKNSFGWKFVVGFIVSVTLLFKSTAGGAASIEQNSSVQFAVTDPRTEINESLSPHLALKIRGSVDAQGRRYGWDIAVIDRRLGDYPNFLYDCLCGHGPRPNDLYAWHFREMLYPPKRVLPVYGYPFEIRVACKDCRIDGDTAADAHFTAGVVEVTWRRLPKSNPRQSTLADFR